MLTHRLRVDRGDVIEVHRVLEHHLPVAGKDPFEGLNSPHLIKPIGSKFLIESSESCSQRWSIVVEVDPDETHEDFASDLAQVQVGGVQFIEAINAGHTAESTVEVVVPVVVATADFRDASSAIYEAASTVATAVMESPNVTPGIPDHENRLIDLVLDDVGSLSTQLVDGAGDQPGASEDVALLPLKERLGDIALRAHRGRSATVLVYGGQSGGL